MANKSLRTFIKETENNELENTYMDYWYDWFCKEESLKNKALVLGKKVKQISNSSKINLDNQYVFFKNNCPIGGNLYDDFRICDLETGDVIYTITPSSGHTADKIAVKKGLKKGLSSIWGRENSFDGPLLEGSWNDVKKFFGV